MRTVSRLRLLFLVFGTICVLLPLSLSRHVETLSSPSKVILPHFFYFWIYWFLLGQQGPGVDRRNQNAKYIEPMPFHKIPFGGDAGDRTRVHDAFTTKELQQYLYYILIGFWCQPIKYSGFLCWGLVTKV